jgi:Uncharacterised nucleotidyltransferase
MPSHRDPVYNFYIEATRILDAAGIPFLVGGAFALLVYTGIARNTKDFDLMVLPRDKHRIVDVFRGAGFHADLLFSHWLAKVHHGELFIDIIFNSGNGLCPVDELWFKNAREAELFGVAVKISPPEELLWQKCYIMERERFDGADVAHLIRSCGAQMDWDRVLSRFGADWRVLLSHLILFSYVFPSEKNSIPKRVLHELLMKVTSELTHPSPETNLCRGPYLSRAQYLFDIERWGFEDARHESRCSMTAEEIAAWTSAIEDSIVGR